MRAMARPHKQLLLGFTLDSSFMPIYLDAIRHGGLRMVSGNAWKVYSAIKSVANVHTGVARISIETLQDNANLARATVVSAIKELRREQLVAAAPFRGPHGSSAYYLVEHFIVQHQGEAVGTIAICYIPAFMKEMLRKISDALEGAQREAQRFNATHRADQFVMASLSHALGSDKAILRVAANDPEGAIPGRIEQARTFKKSKRESLEAYQGRLQLA